MSETEPVPAELAVPVLPTEHRTKVRMGFALCCAALALAMVFILGVSGAELISLEPGVSVSKTYDSQLKVAGTVNEVLVDSLLIGGLVCLYLVPLGQRWRLASSLLLAMLGVDVAILCLHIAGGDPVMLALTEQLGLTLGWVELWALAVLAADAAESIDRPDITYQTEVAGRLILWGGFIWLAFMIWTFDLKRLGEPAAAATGDEFAIILGYSSLILRLFACGRAVMICGALAGALATSRPQPPGQAA